MKFPETYELVKEQEIQELSARGFLLSHKKTGARIFLLECGDENKVYDIAFRTPPEDNSGIPHILEHSVLCGSERYPLKDPFVELAKGSMNTFLNALTYPEKTMYPVASVNTQDFKNLMSVYTDAVFCPNIRNTDLIFRQEGWHYELDPETDELTINGVVYNEMRGAFSDPDSVLERFTKRSLFPDTPYAFESGGLPDAIPTLTPERLRDYHRRYYHPSNAYIYLYGKMDYYERLDWLDREYLSHYDRIDPKSAFPEQPPFSEIRDVQSFYGISEGEDEQLAIFSYAKAVGGLMDPCALLAFDVLAYALLNAPGAPIRKALQHAGIGTDIYGGYDPSYRIPVFSVTARDAKKEDYERFFRIIDEELSKAAEKGISEKTLLAGINSIEFSVREADYGRFPKGLAYGFQAYDTWIHDDLSPMLHLTYNDSFRFLKEAVHTSYYTDLIRDRLLNNGHGVRILLEPKTDMAKAQDDVLAARLAELRVSLSEEEREKLIQEAAALRTRQETPDSEDAVRTLPVLQLSDIKREAEPLKNEEVSIAGIPGVLHRIHTAGISYIELLFDLKGISLEEFSVLPLLKNLYTEMDTAQYSYQDLNDEISLYTGGIGFDLLIVKKNMPDDSVHEMLAVRAKAVTDRTGELIRLIREIVLHTDFSDTERIHEIVAEIRTQLRDNMVSSGHATAMKRVLSYSSKEALEDEQISGVDFYHSLEDLDANFDERKTALVQQLESLRDRIFRKQQMLVSITAEEDGLKALEAALPELLSELPSEEAEPADRGLYPVKKNEGFMTSSSVQYVAMGGNFAQHGYRYSGAYRVLRTLLGYDYLWANLRERGGAYGCMSYFNRNGETAFMSYRDPNLKETLEVFRGIPGYLETLSLNRRDLDKYIIGTLSDMDAPSTPSVRGRRSLMAYLIGVTDTELQQDRDEVLSCTAEDLKALAAPLRAVLSDNNFTVVGSTEMIRSCEEIFGSIRMLTGEYDGE